MGSQVLPQCMVFIFLGLASVASVCGVLLLSAASGLRCLRSFLNLPPTKTAPQLSQGGRRPGRKSEIHRVGPEFASWPSRLTERSY